MYYNVGCVGATKREAWMAPTNVVCEPPPKSFSTTFSPKTSSKNFPTKNFLQKLPPKHSLQKKSSTTFHQKLRNWFSRSNLIPLQFWCQAMPWRFLSHLWIVVSFLFHFVVFFFCPWHLFRRALRLLVLVYFALCTANKVKVVCSPIDSICSVLGCFIQYINRMNRIHGLYTVNWMNWVNNEIGGVWQKFSHVLMFFGFWKWDWTPCVDLLISNQMN